MQSSVDRGRLHGTRRLSLRTARREVALATATSDRFTATGHALAAAEVSAARAGAIVRVLDQLPTDFEPEQVEAEETMLDFPREFDPIR